MDNTPNDLNTPAPKHKLHPLIATACAAVIIASLVGVAAMTGLIGNNKNVPLAQTTAPVLASNVIKPITPKTPPVHIASHPYVPQNVYNDYPAPENRCYDCGVVTRVTPIQEQNRSPISLGTIVGAAGGGLLGNQFGHGNGRTLATVAGAVGGGYVGNRVEQNMSHVAVYRTQVKFEDGSYRNFDFRSPQFRVGEYVREAGGSLVPR